MTRRVMGTLAAIGGMMALGVLGAGCDINHGAADRAAGGISLPREAPPQFDAMSTGPYPADAARALPLRGAQTLLLDAKAGENVSLRVRPSHYGSPVVYRFIGPDGTKTEGQLKENEERALSFQALSAGTCQLRLDTDSSVSSVMIAPRPAVIKSPVRLQGGARLYFHVPRETNCFDVFLCGKGKDEHGKLDLFDSTGKHVAVAETNEVDGKATLARIHATVTKAEAGKTWYVLVRGSEKMRSYQDATLSFSPEIPPYVSLAPETLMREREFAPGELKALYGPFVGELRKRVEEAPRGGAGTAYWRARLDGRIKRLEDTLPPARSFEAQERLRAELLDADAFATAFAEGRLGFDKCLVRVVKAISDRRILPEVPFQGGIVGGPLLVVAAPGEYESGSFVVAAEEKLARLMVRSGTLVSSEGARIAASNVDVKAVKVWYQDTGRGKPGDTMGGYSMSLRAGRQALVPELLLHDDALVRVDTKEEKNYVRVGNEGDMRYVCVSGEAPVPGKTMEDFHVADAPALLPLDVPAGANKQFWVTVHVPEDAPAGIYEGTLELSCAAGPIGDLPFKVRVLPFKLVPARHIASLYYYGPDKIYYGSKRMEQFRKEMENLHAHSIDDVTMPFNVFEEPEAYDIRKSIIGDKAKVVFYGGWEPRFAKTPGEAKENAAKHLDALRKHGVETVYFYGLDEAEGEKLTAQRALWNAVHEAGGKIYVAGYPTGYPGREDKKSNFELMGDLQDLLVCAWEPSLGEARRWHGKNHKIVSYANPQAGIEMPDLYRRNFGLQLWRNEYDGLMTYLYHWGASYAQDWGKKPGARRFFPCVWNDDGRKDQYRQHNMVYPTSDGVVDTLQWEGYREAADDLRYMDTLCRLVEAKGASASPELNKARAFLAELKGRDFSDRHLDMDVVRAEVIDQILALQRTEAGGK